jgi:Na+/H+ antiporter NhaD/arsenite permease-like protein
MDITVLLIFAFVYLGMILGEIPGLALDRTGIALLGAIAYLATGHVTPAEAWQAIDVPTIGLLFGLMVVSAQFQLGGFYSQVTRWLASAPVGPRLLLAMLIVVAGVLSAVLVNDIACLAIAPLLVEGCARRKLNPMPFLLALACASNVGSAATLIGNPQNMLIGQTLRLSFAGYLADAAVPSILGLVAVWAVIARRYRNDWFLDAPVPPQVEAPPYNPWQTSKGLILITLLIAGFLFIPAARYSRESLALAAAGILLLSRTMSSRRMLERIDWQLLILFVGLFIVNHVLAASGALAQMMGAVARTGVEVSQPAWLFGSTVVLSNLVSNVPAVMLLLPVAKHPLAGPILALSSTLAGNLLIVGSIANIIVVDQAARLGVRISWGRHARVGVPVTVITLAIAALWLWLRAAMMPG